MAEKGDIVQVTNERHHWYACLVVVEEDKSFGVQGYAIIPNNIEGKLNAQAYIRLNRDDYAYVGSAVVIAV